LLYTRFFEYDVARLWEIVQRAKATRADVRLWVIGQGFFGEEQRLTALAREAGWRVSDSADAAENDLVYAGYVPTETLPAHFAQADVALYPFDDTLVNRTKCPVKLLDLLAAGLPIVGDAVGEIANMIRDGETGLLVPPENRRAFVEAVIALLDDPPRRKAIGARAAADVRKQFSWDALAEQAERAYQLAS
jgi:glycosyltransferase involved in cell wall biosynthesis